MQLNEKLKTHIEKEIVKLDYSMEPKELYAPIGYTILQEAKRIRPIFTLLACGLFSKDIESAVKPALGIEVFHNFTLLHDDIMDNANIRRGNPTVYKKWGTNIAILSGDTMLIEAYKLINQAPEKVLKKVHKVFSETAQEVCEGQMYDMKFETESNVSIEEYLQMIKQKTAVLIAGALKIGAIIGNANDEEIKNIYNFGLNLGMAFQLLDDWLDVYSDPKVFGKQTGGDIIVNKKTYLLISAINKANEEQKNILNTWLVKEKFDEKQKIATVKAIYDELKIGEWTMNKAKQYSEQAFDYLNKINKNNDSKQSLKQIGKELLNRIK